MKRERARLSAAAARVEADLRRTTHRPWTCSVADDYTLHVTDGALGERVLLDPDIEDEDWFAPSAASPAEIEEGLDADANEVLANEVVDVVQTLGLRWPVCEVHGQRMAACSGWWYCNGAPYHDVAAVGSLEQG